MKKRFLFGIFSLTLAGLILTSCSTQSNDFKTSRGTGRALNGKEGDFKFNPRFRNQITAPGLVFIEGGTFTFGEVQDDVMNDWNNTPTQQHVRSFYMDETEVTNLMYLEYLDWLKKVFPTDVAQYRNIYKGALPDTMVWRTPLGYNEDLVNNYLRHPAYALYPVVGVNWIQAVQYCNWRTDRVNELLLYKSGKLKGDALQHPTADQLFSTETYLNAPELAFGGNTDMYQTRKKRKNDTLLNVVNRTSGIILPAYRLPTEVEWEYAAKADIGLREYNTLKGRKIYPWKGTATRDLERGKNRGKELANFKISDGNYDGLAGWSDDAADITAPVKTYPPNDFGLYDMAGNVNEWVGDVYRQIIDDEASDFNYYRGNIYTKQAFDENGKLVVITTDSIPMDTLPNGKIIVSQLPGSPGRKAIDDNELYLRQNFDRADNRDYRDGDVESSRNYMKEKEDVESDPSLRMYNAPVHEVYTDSTAMVKNYDKSNNRSTLINNEVRVIKGGSWRDRAYWLDPSQRRFYPQYLSRNDIGFRCAMSRVGNKSINKSYRRPVN